MRLSRPLAPASRPPTARAPTPIEERGFRIIERLRGRQTAGRERAGIRIGVALGGGSARGLTHIPYIEALDEMGLKPSVIAGTSIGSLIGAGWAAGMSGRELREHAYEMLGTLRGIAGRVWAQHLPGVRSVFKSGVSVGLNANAVVRGFAPAGFPETFEDLAIPLYVVATDFQSWHQVVFNSGPLRPAIAGSIAIPTMFRPVRFANHLLVDGGVTNPLPLDQADIDTDFLIGIDVNGDPSDGLAKLDHRALDIFLGSAQIMMHSLTAHMMAAYPPDVYLRPRVNTFGMHEFWRVKDIMEQADRDKDRFKRLVDARLEAHLQGKRAIGS